MNETQRTMPQFVCNGNGNGNDKKVTGNLNLQKTNSKSSSQNLTLSLIIHTVLLIHNYLSKIYLVPADHIETQQN